ncbi:MAG: hypothetical protein Q7K65_01560 [Candidatus Buchananbacteria bacterium]|nr:hypothetical protein [Candidatus Buchananbacteria bacterium]
MIFILIRVFPFFIPVLYWIILKTIFIFDGRFLWPLFIALAVDFLYFLFIFLKKKNGDAFVFLLHSFVLMLAGFSYVLILSSSTFINLFLVAWSLIYLLYLESIFHYFYDTKRVILLDLKNIIAYVNLIAFFFLTSLIINLRIFINFSLVYVFVAVGLSAFILAMSQLRVNGIPLKKSLIYSIISALLLIQILIAVLFLSVSFYVSAIILTVLYYLLSSFLVLSAKENLTKAAVWQYIIFTLIVMAIVSVTAQWL